MAEKKKVILDCDTGLDDAIAIMLAARHLDVLGVTAVMGNCTVDDATTNSIKVLEAIGLADQICVHRGQARPMVAPPRAPGRIHGPHGLGDVELPEPVHASSDVPAVDFIAETAMRTEGVTIIATGPLTNVAEAFNREPRAAGRVAEVVMMGGSVFGGSVTPAAETNVSADPEAAHVVFNSGAHVKMAGVNLTRQATYTLDQIEGLRGIGTRTADLAADLASYYARSFARPGQPASCRINDACAVAWAIDPSIITAAPMHIDVELAGTLTRGMTVCDCRHLMGTDPKVDIEREPQKDFVGEAPNAEGALELDFPAFRELLSSTLASYE